MGQVAGLEKYRTDDEGNCTGNTVITNGTYCYLPFRKNVFYNDNSIAVINDLCCMGNVTFS